MDVDHSLTKVLEELGPLMDNPPLPASPQYSRFRQLIEEIERHRNVGPAHPFAAELKALGERIDALSSERETERHAHDLSPGADHLTPMLGLDFRHR
jgi:hypothetical protein